MIKMDLKYLLHVSIPIEGLKNVGDILNPF